MSDEADKWIIDARQVLEDYLKSPEIGESANQQTGFDQHRIDSWLDVIIDGKANTSDTPTDSTFGRWVLATAALQSLKRVPGLAVVSEVKRLICADYKFICQSRTDAFFVPGRREFREIAGVTRLRRFIAGTHLHWQTSGVPRSWLLKMSWPDRARVLRLASKSGGFAPYFEAHIPSRGSTFLIESEYKRSYARMIGSLALQPDVLGITGSSWLHAEETVVITPQLRWINNLFLENGGMLIHMGPAPVDSGFLIGSSKRRELYESKRYHPRVALFIWPRQAALNWAQRQEHQQLTPPSTRMT